MKFLNVKLALAAVAIAALATPALAARSHQARQPSDTVQNSQAESYPDGGAGRTGTAASVQSGAEFNLQSHAND